MVNDERKPYQTVHTSRLYEGIVLQIEARIASGDLQVGDRLPPQRQLAQELGVSPPVVKEALRALAAKGLVEVRRGSGAYVSDKGIIAMSDIMNLLADDRWIKDLSAAREWIEQDVARLAVLHATPEDLTALWKALSEIEEEIARTGLHGSKHVAFHRCLAQASHNRIYGVVMDLLLSLTYQFLRPRRPPYGPQGPAYGLLVHRRIVEALETRDLDRVSEALHDHWQEARESEDAQEESQGSA